MTVDEMIAEELEKSGPSDLAGLPLEVQLDKKGAYSISGTLPRGPKTTDPDDDLRVALD